MPQPTVTCVQQNMRRRWPEIGCEWNHNHAIGSFIARVHRNDHGGTALVFIGQMDLPNLATTGKIAAHGT